MKTVTLFLEETLKYKREVVIRVPDSVTEKEVEQLINKAMMDTEKSTDVPYAIKKINPGIVVTKLPSKELDSPDAMEVDIKDWDIR